jgi:hypothetical protein
LIVSIFSSVSLADNSSTNLFRRRILKEGGRTSKKPKRDTETRKPNAYKASKAPKKEWKVSKAKKESKAPKSKSKEAPSSTSRKGKNSMKMSLTAAPTLKVRLVVKLNRPYPCIFVKNIFYVRYALVNIPLDTNVRIIMSSRMNYSSE